MKLYGLKSCDLCRKAQKLLTVLGHNVTFVDVRADGLSKADLERFWAEFGDKILNTRSTTWRGLSDAERCAPPLTLLADHPTLMKRPVIDCEGSLTLGWTKEVQSHFT